jgi:pimeloyl-ACP methyl ester carboxylesterase
MARRAGARGGTGDVPSRPMRIAYAYLHGLGSGPSSRKGAALRAAYASRGIEVLVPELHLPSARQLSIRAIWDHLMALDASLGAPRWRLVGSSLGGWLAGRMARETGRVDRAVLLSAPLRLRGLWDRVLSDEARAQWSARGSMLFPDVHGRMQRVGHSFYEDVVALGSEPNGPLPCPALFFHGTRDPLLTMEESREQAALSGGELVVLDDDHELTQSIELVTARAVSFLEG